MVTQEPHVRIDRKQVELKRHYSHDRAAGFVEPKCLPNQRRICAEYASPEAMGQHDDATGLIVLLCERPTQLRLTAECLPEHVHSYKSRPGCARDFATMEHGTNA